MARPTTLDTTQLAKLIDVSPRHVRRLADEGVLERARDETGKELQGRWEMLKNNHGYIHHLREGRHLDDTSENKKAQLTNRRLAAEAELAELRLLQVKGKLHRKEDVDFWIGNMLGRYKSRTQAIPQRVSRALVGQTDERVIRNILQAELDLALRELSMPDERSFAKASEELLTDEGAGLAVLKELRGGANGEKDQGDEPADD